MLGRPGTYGFVFICTLTALCACGVGGGRPDIAPAGDEEPGDGGGDADGGDPTDPADGGDALGPDDGVGDPAGDANTPCALTQCADFSCKTATACVVDGEGIQSCTYVDAADESACDLPGTPSASAGGICDAGVCITPALVPCTANGECGADESCIAGFCAPPSLAGGVCDIEGGADAEDCGPLTECDAESALCLGQSGALCAQNRHCLDSCIAGACAPRGGWSDTCDLRDDFDCLPGYVCDAGICLLQDGEPCAADAACKNTCVENICVPPVADGAFCESDNDCAIGVCNHGLCAVREQVVYVVEVQGHYASNGATLTELDFYEGTTELDYVLGDLDAYDSVRNGLPAYWGGDSWGSNNLFDDELVYGGTNTMIICHVSANPGPDPWARFAVFLPEGTQVSRIAVTLGSNQGRIPYYVRIYRAEPYDFDGQIIGRSDQGLTLLWTITPDETWTTIRTEEMEL